MSATTKQFRLVEPGFLAGYATAIVFLDKLRVGCCIPISECSAFLLLACFRLISERLRSSPIYKSDSRLAVQGRTCFSASLSKFHVLAPSCTRVCDVAISGALGCPDMNFLTKRTNAPGPLLGGRKPIGRMTIMKWLFKHHQQQVACTHLSWVS